MSFDSVLTIAGTPYAASQRAAASILPTGLERTLDGGYDELTFWEIPTSPHPTYAAGTAVGLAIDIGDGNGSVVRFAGVIVDCQSEHGPLGWGHAYTCAGLKFLADRVPVTAVDNTGTQVYNRSPLDEYYTPSDAGLELGEIFGRILTIPATAQLLNAVGIGNYTGLPSAPVLPAATVADLARLTIVPPRPVIFQGAAVFNAMDQEGSQWMPKFFSEIEPDGTIRFKDSTDLAGDFVPRTITCPSATAAGDPVTTPRVQRSTRNCATRLVLRGGPQVEVAILSLVDGTLAEVFTSGDKTSWNLTFFTAPKGATDYGDVTAVTSTSATLQSHDPLATWSTNFWSNNNAIVNLIDSVGSLIDQFETRLVTSNDALAAAGTSTVHWDSTWPITGTAYDSYRITGGAGGLIDVWRTYTPREPLTGHTGLDTYVGAHLVTRSAHAVRVANADQTFHAYYTTAIVKGGSLGQEMPLGIQAVPSEGMFRFTQPTVTVFGQAGFLNTGSPTTAANGLPTDVIVYALYSRGALSVVVPPDVLGVPQYEGTAYTEDGIEHTAYLDFPAWLWVNDAGSFAELAQQVLDTLAPVEVDLSISWYMAPGEDGPAWDWLSFGYALNVAIAGQSSPWDAIDAPIRGISVKWDWTGQGTQVASFHASTRRRAFAGFDLYIHPEFAQGSPLVSAFTEQNSRGNYEDYDELRKAGGLPLAATPADVVARAGPASAPYSLGAAAAGGDPARAKGKPASVRSPEDQAEFAAGHESPLERRARETGERRSAREAKEQGRQDRREAKEDAKDDRRDAAADAKADRKAARVAADDARDAEIHDRARTVAERPSNQLRRPADAEEAFHQGIAGRGAMGPARLDPSPEDAAAGEKADRQAANRTNLGRLEAGKLAEQSAAARTQASDDFYAGRGERNLDREIVKGREVEDIRARNEAKEHRAAQAEVTRILDASMSHGLPFDE